MNTVTINRPKPMSRRNDPERKAMIERLSHYSSSDLDRLEAAIDQYVRDGHVAPEISDLLPTGAAQNSMAH